MPVRVISQSGKGVLVATPDDITSGSTEEAQELIDSTISTGVTSFAALRTKTPRFTGEKVLLIGWNEGSDLGGGWFTGTVSTTAATDDGGVIAAGSGFYWTRDVYDVNDLDVTHFGAINDGATDCAFACTAMLEFTMSDYAKSLAGISSVAQNGIRFPPGTFYITPVDWRKYGSAIASGSSDLEYYDSGYYAHGGIKIQGAQTPYGKQILTKILSDKSTSAVFQLNHRRMSITNLWWDGQQSTGYDSTTMLLKGATQGTFNDTASNIQPFVTNECVAGCYMYLEHIQIANIGGAAFYVKDTLDSIVEQLYSEKNAAPVVKIGWSNYPTGVWDHSTSVEFRNCNFLTNLAPCIWAPRCQQSIMNNVWFSGPGNVPFDINNGQWIMKMMCVEGCVQEPVLWSCKNQVEVLSVPTGNTLDYDTTPSGGSWYSYPLNPDGSDITLWNGAYDLGESRSENHGMEMNGTMKAKWYTGVIRGTNNTTSVQYLNIGSFTFPNVGAIWEIEIICRDGYSSVGTPPYTATADRTPGKTIIRVQRGAALIPIVTYYHVGSSGVTGVQYQSQTYNNILPALWVKINSYVGEYVINVKGTGPTRFDAGTCALFTINGNTTTTNPSLNAATPRFSIHNGSAGIGAQGSYLAMTTGTGTPTTTTAATGYMEVYLNGVIAYIPYYT